MKKDYFIPKMFRRLLVPSVISYLGFALADVADSLVLGTRMGEVGLAAISICLPVFMLINFITDGLATGGCVRFSKLVGEGREREACECFNRIWFGALMTGVIFGAVFNIFAPQILRILGAVKSDGAIYTVCMEYMRIISAGSAFIMLNIVFSSFLRNDNNAEIASIGFLAGSITDISLNVIFVLVLRLGVRGSAFATIIGSGVAVCCYLFAFASGRTNFLHFKLAGRNLRETADCLKNGFSTSVQNLYQLVFLLLINNLLMKIGGEGDVAVFDVLYNASLFIIYMYNASSEAMQPLISVFTGEKNLSDCKTVFSLAKKSGAVIGGTVAAMIFVFAENISRIFGLSGEYIGFGAYALRIYCIGFLFICLNVTKERYYQAREKSVCSFIIAILRNFAVLIPCLLLLCRFGDRAIWFVFPVTEALSFFIFAAFERSVFASANTADSDRTLIITITDTEELEGALLESEEFCTRLGASDRQLYLMRFIIEELCMSVVRNAFKGVEDGKIRITVNAEDNGDFTVRLLDNAVSYNPFLKKGAKVDLNKDFDVDAVSISVIKKGSREFTYRRSQGFNAVAVRI